ncbi:MAG TPA: DUF6600 domain-containing protein [Bryobacteraceae bacterium]|nr:DUF6600 domain-containing protein [Bryobacteraceae bacterium]
MKRGLWASTAILALGAALLAQQPSGAPADDGSGDDAKHAVARISVINGVVSVRRGDSGEASAAALNAPLSETDRLFTAEGSRSEIQFDALNMIRLAPNTEVRLGELAYHRYQVQIASGTTTFRVMRDNDADIEISTPALAVRPLKKGIYRVTVNQEGSTQVTVRQGEAEISSPKGTEKLGSSKTMVAHDASGEPGPKITGAIASDQWDKWNVDRDHDLEQSPSGRYVNPDVNGTEELDANGRWVNDPAYGQVWVPNAAPGWAPYQVGRWVWVDYYGWTWVSGDPWGWAPYHYGRWYMGAYGWAWWPGAMYGPYYWQPALVGFFGWGGFGIGFGFGNIGWVPLAPYERYYHGYGYGAGVVAHNVNITNVYRNARVSNGVTSMAAGEFGHNGVSGATSVRASAADLAHAGSVRGSLPVTPSRESTHFSSAPAGAVHSSGNSNFYSSRPSSAASSRPSFEQQRQAVARSASRFNTAPSAGSSPAPAATPRVSGPPTSTSQSSNSVSSRSAAPASTGSTQMAQPQRFNGSTGRNYSGVAQSSATAGRPSVGTPQAVRINPSVVQNRGVTSSGSSRGSSAPSRGGSSGGSRGGSGGSHGGGGGRR